ncbi:hypothetical protein BN59_03785 [Legionella massiliensis]|uniref:Uncharacterized protein n=1 Tax=Legionella massiliensis TaxID=1034943 RepID=A0A078L2M9_9GAMM|nr:hypothetical protein [Legionella massiliensis]CDZ79467.1 hypothetical protein BN59_03785 [Legionella massiliensis]CEE15205.1 hypothetical protein BN1094_03785 [Legionella massiliensis]
MSQRTSYKRIIICSTPFNLLKGGFSTNGHMEIHTVRGVSVKKFPGLQARIFATEDEADENFTLEARRIIDQLIP